MVALLATWCPYCQKQVTKMEELKKDLEADRVQVNFIAVNIQSGEGDQARVHLALQLPVVSGHQRDRCVQATPRPEGRLFHL